jgi:choline transport protein
VLTAEPSAEEVQDASIVLPKVLIWSIVPNGIMAVLMGVTFIFCIGDIDSVLASPTNEPFIQVFYNATQSYAGATIMASIIAIMLTSVGFLTFRLGGTSHCAPFSFLS